MLLSVMPISVFASDDETSNGNYIVLNGGSSSSTNAPGSDGSGIVSGTTSAADAPDADVKLLSPTTLKADSYIAWPSGAVNVDRPLQIVMNFKANETLEAAKAGKFGKWKCDFYLTVTGLEDGSVQAKDCYLAGSYGNYGWIVIPADDMTVENGVTYPVVSGYDANLTYENICDYVKDFTAAIYISEDILAANPDFKVTLALKMTNPENENDVITIGSPAVYDVEALTNGGKAAEAVGELLNSTQVGGTLATDAIADVEAAKAALKALNSNLTDDDIANADIDLVVEFVESVSEGAAVKSYTFNVTPMYGVSNSRVEVNSFSENVSFKLPVPSSVTESYANIYHEGAYIDTVAVQTEGDAKYVVVSSDSFSEYTVEPTADEGITGTGTEADPFVIADLADLYLFASSVNGGNSYKGQFVKLAADVDLAGAEWTPIGKVGASFQGTFDGADHTVSNLKVSSGSYIGLFGRIDGASINNVKVVNPVLNGTSYVGAIVGMGYTGSISNCHVSGDISIIGNYMVGGINGHGYARINNCSVIGNDVDDCVITGIHDGGSNEGDNVGGIVGHSAENVPTTNCTVKNVTIMGTRKVGGITGITNMSSDVSGATLENVKIGTNATVDYANDNLKTMSIGGVVGQYQASGTAGSVANATINGVSFLNTNSVTVSAGVLAGGMRGTSVVLAPSAAIAADDVVVADVEGATADFLEPLYVAKLGDNGYASSLKAAFAAAEAGDTITLLADVALTEALVVAKGASVALDLAGKIVSYTSAVQGEDMITNYGALVISDSVGGGKITYCNTDTTAENVSVNTISNGPCGVLTVNGGTIENTTALSSVSHQIYAFAIDNLTNGSSGAAKVIVNGGTIKSNYRSIRLFANSTTDENSVVINGGSFIGQVWLQASKASAQVVSLAISGGSFQPAGNDMSSVFVTTLGATTPEFSVTGGEFATKIGADNATLACNPGISGGSFTEAAMSGINAGLIAEGCTFVANSDGSYGVAVDPAYGNEAQIGSTYYATLEEAAQAAQVGDTIKLLSDVALDATLTLPAGITLDGNGKAISGTILAGGELTISGHVKVTSFNVAYTNLTINIVEGGCLELTGTGRMVIGHGTTFNITGSVTDAKTANVADLTPSLIMPGASFTGAGVTFNVTNAYIKTTASYCSSSSSASGTFDFNITNSIWEQFGKLAFESQSTAATVNFELKDSVLTTTSHLVFGVSRGEIVIDNSNVNVGQSRQIENQSTMTVKNGSVVNGAVATSSNAKNPGTLIIDNATYSVTGEFSGSDLGTGTLIVKNGGSFTAGSITKADIVVDATGMGVGDTVSTINANLSNFAGTIEVVNNDNLEAEIVDGKIVLTEKPAAKIGEVKYATLKEAFAALSDGDTLVILAGEHSEGTIKLKAALSNVTVKGEDGAVLKNMTIMSSDGNSVKYSGITFDGIVFEGSNIVFTGARNGEVIYKDITITNCEFYNVVTNNAFSAVHFNLASDETIENLTFTNNVVNGVSDDNGDQYPGGLRANYVSGIVTITGNKISNVPNNAIQVINVNASKIVIENNILASELGAITNLYNVTSDSVSITGNQFLVQDGQKALSYISGVDVSGNYWNGSAPANLPDGVTYKDYYTTVEADGTLSGKVELPYGTLTNVYTSDSTYWGECGGNAKESFVFKFYNGDTYMGYTSLNNVGGIIDGSVYVSWNIKLDAASNTDEYWTMAWEIQPTIAMQPTRCEQWVDGVKVAEAVVEPNWSDKIFPVSAAVTDENGTILSYVNGTEGHTFADAVEAGGYIYVFTDVTADISAFENVTLSGNNVTVTNTKTGWVNMVNVTVGSGVTLEIGSAYFTGGGDNVIEGTLSVETLYNANNSKITVRNGGNIVTTGMIVNRYHSSAEAGIYVYGDGDDSTVEVSCADTIGTYSGTFYAKDAVVKANMLWIDYLKGSTEESDTYAQSTPIFNNSNISITKELRFYKDSTITLIDSDVTAGTVQVRENATPTVSIDENSSIKANEVLNLNGASSNAVIDENGNVSFVKIVAKIGNTNYETLADALAAVNAGETITLLNDVTISDVLVIDESITIDGNGKTITYTGSNRIVDIAVGGLEITLKNLNLVSSASYCQRGINIGADVDVTLDNVSVKGENVTYALNLPGSSKGSEIIIKDSDFAGCIALNVWGANAVINATNSDFTSVDKATHENYAAVSVNNDGTTAAEGAVITITGGTITALDENNQLATAIRNSTATGTVNVSESTVVTGTVRQPVAIVTYNGYNEFYSFFTLQEALDKATNDPTATLKLLKDITVSDVIALEGNITIDGNGKTITYTGSSRIINIIVDGLEITLKNLNLVSSASYCERGINIGADVDVTLDNVSVKGTNVTYAVNLPATSSGAAVTIKDSDFTGCIALNVWGENVVVNATDSEFTSVDNAAHENYAAIVLNNNGEYSAENTVINIIGGKITALDENDAPSVSVTNSTATGTVNVSNTTDVTGDVRETVAIVYYEGYTEFYSEYTLQDALNKATNDPTATVKLLKDITVSETLVVNGVVVLDLNGKTVSGVCNANQDSLIYIENSGKLTINDSSAEKAGKITYASGSSNVGFAIDLEGALVLEAGTIELTGSWSIGYAVDVRPNSWGTAYTEATTFVMNGGNIVSSDGAVRVASSSADAHKNVSASFVMNGGKIDAAWDGVFIQQSNTIYDDLSFTINGGIIESDLNPVRVYGPLPTGYVNDADCMSIDLKGGTLTYTGTETRTWIIDGILRAGDAMTADVIVENGDLTVSAAIAENATAPEGFIWADNGDGTYGIVVDPTYGKVAKIGDTYYATLADAIAAANDGDIVTLLSDLTIVGETYTIADGVSITLDMNGKKLTATDDKAANVCYELFYIYGELTVTGNGTIELTSTSGDESFAKSSTIFHNRGGVLTVENGTYKHLGGTCMAFAIDNSGNWFGDATTNINGGNIESTYIAIRNRMEQNSHGSSGKATVNVNGGTIVGVRRAIWGQAASTSETSPATGAININDGTIVGSIETSVAAGSVAMTTINGGNVEKVVAKAGELTVKGGTVGDVVIYNNNAVTDYAVNSDGVYVVAVAKIGDNYYATLSDAVAALKENGGTLTLLDDANESITFNYPADGAPTELTIDLNGFTITSAESTVWVSDGYKVTIKDSAGTGKIISTNAGGEAIAITRNGHVILESGYVYNDFCAVWMYNATENGTFVMNGGTLEVPNGGQALSVGAGKATINGGKILCNKIPGGGGWNTLVYANGALEITGGEFLGTIGSYGTVSISGGTFSYPDDPNDGFNKAHLADGYEIKTNNDGSITVYALPTSLQGSGTAEDPYLINNLDDLKFFRNSVNNGNRYNGQFVKLTADIDLNDEEWTPIGDRNVDQGSFLGTFDGDNHKISNLWISEWNKTGAGFFSKVGNQTEYVSGTVKNVTFENVTIVSSESYVGVIAQAPSGALIENVHVTGDITISGYGYVGGIVGHGYPTINNSSVIGDGTGTITANYWGAGAILGFSGDYGSHITNAIVEGVTIHGNYGGAASVTGSPYGAAVNGATVKDVVITSNSDYCMGYVSAGGTVENVTVENVTASAADQPITPADAVATVNGKIYFDFAEAVAAAQAGETITLMRDVTVTEKFNLTGVNLDLGGKTMFLKTTGNYIVDAVTISNGTIDISGNTLASGTNTFFTVGGQWAKAGSVLNLDKVNLVGDGYRTEWAVICVHNGTSLNITDSTIDLKNDNGTAGGFIKDTSGNNNTATVVISNTKINLANVDRGFTGAKVTLDTVELTITGGEHGINGSELLVKDSTVSISDGTGRGITLNKFDSSIVNSTVTLTNMGEGGIRFKTANALTVDADSKLAATSAHADVEGATVNGKAVTGTEDDMSTVTVADGVTTVVNPYYEAEINGTKYESIAEALAAAQPGDTVTILAGTYAGDISVNKDITVIGETDGEGNNLVTINGQVSITGNGATVENLNVSVSVENQETALYINGGDILVKGCNVSGYNVTRFSYVQAGGVTFQNCNLDGYDYTLHFDSLNGDLTIDGCTLDDWSAIGAGGNVIVTNTTFEVGESEYNTLRTWTNATYTGCEFEKGFDLDLAGDAQTLKVVDSTYTDGTPVDIKLFRANDTENFEITVDGVVMSYAAKIGGNYYETLAEAFAAAQDGDTVTLVADVEIGTSIYVNNKKLTFDGNGHKITQAAGSTYGDYLVPLRFNNGEYTIKNVIFDGWTTKSVLRIENGTAVIDNLTIQNTNWNKETQAKSYGVLYIENADVTVQNSKFLNNVSGSTVTYGYGSSDSMATKLVIDNCLFEGNVSNGDCSIVYYVKGSGCTIKNSEFIDNTVNCNTNGATIYLGFQDNCVLTGNLFKNNTVTDSSTSTRVAGAIFAGYQATITDNAFEGNTASNANGDVLGQVCISTYYEDGYVELSGNYWNGGAPVYGEDYTIQHQTGAGDFGMDSYYNSYEVDADGNLTLKDEMSNTFAAKIGTKKFTSLLAALEAAKDGETVTLLADVELNTRLIFSLYTAGRNVTLDGNGHKLYASSTNWGTGNGKHLINVNCDNVTLKDIVLDCNNIAEGANIYMAQNITFENVSIINKKAGFNADLTVNGSTLNVAGNLSASYVDVSLGKGVTTPLGITAEDGAVLDVRTLQIASAAYPNTNLDGALSTDGTSYYSLKKVDANGNLAGYSNSLSRLSNGYGYELLEDMTVNSNVTLLNAGHTGTIDTNGYTLTVADGKTLTVNGDLAVTGTGTIAGDLVLGNADASVSGVAGLDVKSSVEHSKVVYENGEYVVVFAVAYIGNEDYYTLDEAFAAAQAGDTITLLADVTLGDVVTIDEAITLDLGGNTVTGADGAIVFIVKAATTIKNGTILGDKSGTTSGLIEIYANLVMDGVTVETSKINALRFKAGDCTATLTNCNVTGAFKGYGGSVWNIESGTYKASSTSINDQLNGTASISGGTFYYEIEATECAPGYVVVNNGDGTYTVKYAPVCFVDANNNGVLDEGEAVYGSLEAVFETYQSGDVYVVITDDVVIDTQVDTDVNAKYYLNTNVAEGVTVEFAYADDWNYVQNMYVGEGVTVEAPYLLVWTDLDVYGSIVTDYLYITVGDVLVAEGASVTAKTGDATVQVKNGATLTVNGELATSILNVWVGGSELVVSGANAKVDASWIDIWDGTPTVSVENGATLEVDKIKASRGGSIDVNGATLDAGSVELGHNGESAGELTVTNGTVTGEIELTAVGSTFAGSEGMNVTTNIPDYKVVYENGVYSVVAKEYVAEVNGTKYEYLADAFAAAEANDIVTIFAGNYASELSVNKAITVIGETDAEGNNLVTFTKLNVTADGATVKNINAIAASGNAGYIDAKDVVIDGCYVKGGNGFRYCYTDGTVTFKNSTITGSTYGIHFDGTTGGEIVIDNCVITGWTSFAGTINKVTMTDTTFEEGNYNYVRFYQNEVVIDGCTFNENMAVDLAVNGAQLTVTDSTLTNGNVEDLFSGADIVNSTITVDGTELVREAMIGETYYKTLAEAVAAAQDGDVITLVDNVASATNINKAVTINGNGKKISSLTINANVTLAGELQVTATLYVYSGELTIAEGASVTVPNSTFGIWDGGKLTVASGAELSAYSVYFNGGAIDVYGTLTAITGGDGALILNGADDVINVYEGGVLNAGYVDIYKTSGNSTVNVYGSANISGFIKDGSAKFTWNVSGTLTTKNLTMANAESALNVSGAVVATGTVTASGTISLNSAAATFTTANDALAVVSGVADYKVVYANGAYALAACEYVAEVGGFKYESITDAIANANAGDTITLIANVNENVTVNKSVTIDGAGFNYTGTMTLNAASITIKDVIFVEGNISKGKGTTASATITIEDCEFYGNGMGGYAISLRLTSTVTVKNCYAEGYGSGFLTLPGANASLEVSDVEVVGENYAFKIDYSGAVSLTRVKISNAGIGIWDSNYGAKTYTLTDCEIDAENPISIWDRGTGITDTFEFVGNNKLANLGVDGDDNLQLAKLVLTVGASLTAPEGLTVEPEEVGYDVQYSDGAYRIVKIVAQVGGVIYGSLQEAIEAAETGDTVVLLDNINLTEADRVVGADKNVLIDVVGKDIILDMNGKTISVVHEDAFTNDYIVAVIRVGDGAGLTVTGNGTIDVKVLAENPDMAYMFWKRGTTGHLTIENGTFHMNDSADSMVYTNGNEIVYIKGGNWTLDSYGSRGNREPWIFNVAGAGDNHVVVTGGTFNADINRQHWSNEVLVPETYYTVANADGTYTVKEGAVAAVYTGMLTGPYYAPKYIGYATFEEAFAAAIAANDHEIKLLADVAVSDSFKIPAGANLTLDLNGKTIAGTDNTTASFGLFYNNGTFTVKDSVGGGKITLAATNDNGWSRYSSVVSNNPGGKFTLESGTIEHLGGTSMSYGIDNLTNGKGTYAETVINGGTVESAYIAIRQFLNGIEADNILTINGGVIGGANSSIYFQDPSTKANTGTLTIDEAASINNRIYLGVTEGSTEWPVELSIAAAALKNGAKIVESNVPAKYDIVLANGVYGVVELAPVAQIGETLYYTIADALLAANDGDTITLVWADGQAPIAMNGALYGGKTVTITGTAQVDWGVGFLFIGRGGEGNATLIFENANLTSASNTGAYGIHVSGREKDTTNKYDGTLIINNSTIELDYLINKGTMTLDNSTLTVKNGFSIGGRPAGETESGEDATATITLNNASNLIVNNHNGMGLGYEAIGVMNVNAGCTFECTQSFLITAKGTMNVVGGSVKVAGTLTNKGAINMDLASKIVGNVDSTGSITVDAAAFAGSDVVVVEGKVTGTVDLVNAKLGVVVTVSDTNVTVGITGDAVASFNGNYYTDLIDAIYAADDFGGGNITLLADATGLRDVSVYDGIVLDLNGYTLETKYFTVFHNGRIIDSSAGKGLIECHKDHAAIRNTVVATPGVIAENSQVPIWDPTQNGYVLSNYIFNGNVATRIDGDKVKYVFAFNTQYFTNLFADGASDNELSVVVKVTWTDKTTGILCTEEFKYSDEHVSTVLTNFGQQFTLTIANPDNYPGMTFQAMVLSGTDMVACTDPVAVPAN